MKPSFVELSVGHVALPPVAEPAQPQAPVANNLQNVGNGAVPAAAGAPWRPWVVPPSPPLDVPASPPPLEASAPAPWQPWAMPGDPRSAGSRVDASAPSHPSTSTVPVTRQDDFAGFLKQTNPALAYALDWLAAFERPSEVPSSQPANIRVFPYRYARKTPAPHFSTEPAATSAAQPADEAIDSPTLLVALQWIASNPASLPSTSLLDLANRHGVGQSIQAYVKVRLDPERLTPRGTRVLAYERAAFEWMQLDPASSEIESFAALRTLDSTRLRRYVAIAHHRLLRARASDLNAGDRRSRELTAA